MITRDRPTACAVITLCCAGQHLSFPGDHVATDKNYLQTGQTGCYDRHGGRIACAGFGQDEETGLGAAWQSRGRFGVHNGSVIDTATGLHWLRDDGFGEFPMTWQEALVFFAHMNHEQVQGERDWRLPNRRELRSLISHQATRPVLAASTDVFDRLGAVYWSSTTSMYEPDWAWALYLDKGAVGVGQKQQGRFSAWAVRGGVIGQEA